MQHEPAARKNILKTIFDVYDLDMSLENDMPVMSSKVPAILVRYTTPEERHLVAKWVRKGFDLDIDWQTYEMEESAAGFEVLLLGLEGDDLDDETFLRLSGEMESYEYIVDRLLKQGRLEEALAEAKQVDDSDILEIADILSEHGYEDQAVQLIKERVDQNSRTDLLHWLQQRYEARGDPEAALDTAKRTFTTHFLEATIERYRQIRELAQRLARWDEVRAELLAYVQREHLTSVEIEIALDEGRVDLALELLEARKQTTDSRNGPYGSGNFDVGLEVAKAAEENYPLETNAFFPSAIDPLAGTVTYRRRTIPVANALDKLRHRVLHSFCGSADGNQVMVHGKLLFGIDAADCTPSPHDASFWRWFLDYYQTKNPAYVPTLLEMMQTIAEHPELPNRASTSPNG